MISAIKNIVNRNEGFNQSYTYTGINLDCLLCLVSAVLTLGQTFYFGYQSCAAFNCAPTIYIGYNIGPFRLQSVYLQH